MCLLWLLNDVHENKKYRICVSTWLDGWNEHCFSSFAKLSEHTHYEGNYCLSKPSPLIYIAARGSTEGQRDLLKVYLACDPLFSQSSLEKTWFSWFFSFSLLGNWSKHWFYYQSNFFLIILGLCIIQIHVILSISIPKIFIFYFWINILIGLQEPIIFYSFELNKSNLLVMIP